MRIGKLEKGGALCISYVPPYTKHHSVKKVVESPHKADLSAPKSGEPDVSDDSSRRSREHHHEVKVRDGRVRRADLINWKLFQTKRVLSWAESFSVVFHIVVMPVSPQKQAGSSAGEKPRRIGLRIERIRMMSDGQNTARQFPQWTTYSYAR